MWQVLCLTLFIILSVQRASCLQMIYSVIKRTSNRDVSPTSSHLIISEFQTPKLINCLTSCNIQAACYLATFTQAGFCRLYKQPAIGDYVTDPNVSIFLKSESNFVLNSPSTLTTTTTTTTKIVTTTTATTLPTGLTNYWPINNDLKDYAGSSNITPMLNFQMASDRFGNPNSSIFLNSGYGMVKPGVYFTGGDFTLMAWIRPLDLDTSPYYVLMDFSNGPSTDNVYLAYSLNVTLKPEIELFNGANQSFIDSNIGLNLNQWNHLVAVLSGNTAMIYVNGSLGVAQNSIRPINKNRTSCFIGRSSWYPEEHDAIAYFDDIRIYNIALTQAQINSIYLGN